MNTTTKLSAALLFVLAAACDNNGTTEKNPPTTTGAVGPAPAVDQQQPKAVEAPAVAAPTTLAALNRPASIYLIDNKSLSRVTDEELLAAAKKAGWAKDDTTVTPMLGGQYESRSFPIEKGKTKGTMKIVRPAATPGTPDSVSGFTPPSTLGASMNNTTSAYTYDPDGDVFVGVDLDGGKAADAKKILDTLVIKGKMQVGGANENTAMGGSGEANAAGMNGANGTANAAGMNGANGTANGTLKGGDGSGNTKDSNAVVPTANGKANSAPRNPTKDSNSIPPKREEK